ncbi:MAG TPA: caspase family protein [Steroidobacteraceae bacterium]|jgi:hypothetical protein
MLLSSHLLAAAAADGVGSPQATVAAGVKRALLIGINNYKAVPHLMGSLNDVAAMRQILVTRWGFLPENVVVLTDEAATRAAILSALRQMVSASGPNDTVVFHYSGHGSQVQDLNGDEEDGLDETLVPWDGRTHGVPDIVDDELDAIFAKLRTHNALIILDSCHSGTGTRGLDFRSRGIERDSRIEEYQDPAVRPSDTGTRAIIPRMESRQLVMSAVPADQEALDGPIEGEFHGVFTYALARSLAASQPGATPRDVFARVSEELKRLQAKIGHTALPEPQLEGPPALLDRGLLATSGAAATSAGPRLAWLDVQPGSAGQITLARGALLGAAPGSTWAIYPPGDVAFAPGRALAVARVTESVGLDAHATLTPNTTQIQAGSRAVLQMPAPGGSRVPVRILDAPEARKRQVETILKQTIQNVDIVDARQPARFLIDPAQDRLRLLTSDGGQVVGTFDGRTDQWGPEVARVISRSAGASDLLSLDNPSSQMQLLAQVMGAAPAATRALASRDIVLVANTRPAQLHIRRPNESRSVQNSLQISLTVSTDAYVTIVDVDSEGHVNLLFPNSYQRPDFWPDGRIPGNQPLMIPDSLVSGRAGFFWDYGPPAGLDTLRIFATSDASTARLIRDRIRALQSGAAGTRSLGDSSNVSTGLRGLGDELAGLATRGIIVAQDPNSTGSDAAVPGDWTATSVSVAITE